MYIFWFSLYQGWIVNPYSYGKQLLTQVAPLSSVEVLVWINALQFKWKVHSLAGGLLVLFQHASRHYWVHFILSCSYEAGIFHTHSLQSTICQSIMTFYMCEYFKVYE